MDELKFGSVSDLYKRILPALKSKRKELNRLNMDYIKEADIWNYLKEKKWKLTSNLLLHEMVSDILGATNEDIDSYVKSKLNTFPRNAIINETR